MAIDKIKRISKSLTEYRPYVLSCLQTYLSRNVFFGKIGNLVLNSLYYSYRGYQIIKGGMRNNHLNLNTQRMAFPKIVNKHFYKRILIIAELSIPQCTLYRVTAKKYIFEKLGYEVNIVSWTDYTYAITKMQFVDFVIFYRVLFFDSVRELYKEADRLGLTKVYDIDDLIFDEKLYKAYLEESLLPASVDQEELMRGCILYKEAIYNSDLFWASTYVLSEIYKERSLSDFCFILPNGVPEQLLEIQKYSNKSNTTDIVKIFYGSGTKTHNSDFNLIKEPLLKILDKYPNVNLYILGELVLDSSYAKFENRIHRIPLLSAESYYAEICEYDIALMPLVENIFNKAKSNIKYIEASVMGVPSIASKLPEFSRIIRNGVNGYVASSSDEWYTYIETLVIDKEARKKIATKAYETVIDMYKLDNQAKVVKLELESKKYRLGQNERKKCLLIANLYYGLNSFGGATIVAEGLSEAIAHREDYEVVVFTTHRSDKDDTGCLRKYNYNGVTVYSICENVDELNDIKNNRVSEIFQEILSIHRPELVHFHAVQGFGYGLAEVCKEYKKPYVITLHDAWPLCPKLFMMDQSGQLCSSDGLSILECKEKCGFPCDWTAERRFALKKFIKMADKVYVPSYYAKCFLGRYINPQQLNVNKNAILPFKGKGCETNLKIIRFLFVAGGARTKGYYLLREVLNELCGYAWELYLIMPNNDKLDGWKSPNIKVFGKQDRRGMQDLYRNVNVLLFPTLAYESFGLTVREAIASDVFVISSRCGGPEEAIVDGENGLLFNMGDKAGFKRALLEVLNNSNKYINYRTSNYGDIRSFDEQAEELLHDYENIIKGRKDV